jgi:antitoxin component of RelBE/YafQ-DinJ toxin-antitoxin module
MRSSACEDNGIFLTKVVNQQEIPADVTFTKARPLAHEFVIAMLRRQWRVVRNQQQHDLLEALRCRMS